MALTQPIYNFHLNFNTPLYYQFYSFYINYKANWPLDNKERK